MDDQPNADPAGFSGPVDPQGTPGGGSPPGNPLPALPAELGDGWPDAVRPQASQTADVRAARGKYATGGVVSYPTESAPGCDRGIETCKERFSNADNFGYVLPKGRVVDIPITIDPIEKVVPKRMAEAMDHLRNILVGKAAANVEQIIIGPSSVVRIRILCPNCGARSQTEQPFKGLAGSSHTMHGRKGRLVDIHVGARCCGKELYAKVPVWLEDDWC